MQNPEEGMVRGSGGVRKLRWRMQTPASESRREDTPAHLLRQLKEEFERD